MATWSDWFKEVYPERVTSHFLGTNDALQLTYLPPANGDAHRLDIRLSCGELPQLPLATLIQLRLAQITGVPREKVGLTPFSERDGEGPVRHGYRVSWYDADASQCPSCWYARCQGVSCDHPLLRPLPNGLPGYRSRLAENAWQECQGTHYAPEKVEIVHMTAEQVFQVELVVVQGY